MIDENQVSIARQMKKKFEDDWARLNPGKDPGKIPLAQKINDGKKYKSTNRNSTKT